MRKYLTILKKLRPAHLLTAGFLAYVIFVSTFALSEFLFNFTGTFYWDTGLRHLIKTTNDQYESMLVTDPNQSLLHDKGTYINLNGLMARLLAQPKMHDRILLTNGHLTHEPDEAATPEQIRQAAENVIRFHDTHTANGGKFLFIMVPTQVSKYENFLPAGYEDTTNGPADDFLTLLEEAGVPYLDLREELQKDGISITDAYYVTDHHWTPETGFWAYGEILNKLEQMDAIVPVDPFYTDPNNYSFITFEDAFLGSSGKRTGRLFAGVDDATYIYPNFETDISVSIPVREMELQGPFEEVAYHNQLEYDFENPDYFNKNFYAVFGWNDNPLTHWRNAQAADQSRFLLIGESFGNIPFSLMSLNLGVCDEIDMRHFEGSFQEYYESYQPETVVLEVNIGAIVSEFTETAYLD